MAKLVAHLLADGCSLGSNPDISHKYKMDDISILSIASKEWPTQFGPQKIYNRIDYKLVFSMPTNANHGFLPKNHFFCIFKT